MWLYQLSNQQHLLSAYLVCQTLSLDARSTKIFPHESYILFWVWFWICCIWDAGISVKIKGVEYSVYFMLGQKNHFKGITSAKILQHTPLQSQREWLNISGAQHHLSAISSRKAWALVKRETQLLWNAQIPGAFVDFLQWQEQTEAFPRYSLSIVGSKEKPRTWSPWPALPLVLELRKA